MRGSVMEQFDQDGLGNETDEAEAEGEERDERPELAGFRCRAHFPDEEQHPADQPADADGERPEFELLNAHENAPGGVIQGRASYAAGWGDANDRGQNSAFSASFVSRTTVVSAVSRLISSRTSQYSTSCYALPLQHRDAQTENH